MAGSDKRISAAQRKKIQVRYKKSGRKTDPATGLVLAAGSMVPVAGVGARAAAVARTAAAASKASKAKKVKVVKSKPQAETRPRFTGERKDGSVTMVRKTKGQRREEMLRERNSSAAKKAAKEAARKKRLRDAAKKAADQKQAKKDIEKAKYGQKPPTTQREAEHKMRWDSLRKQGLARAYPPRK